jgi:hypothetical protein
MSFPHELPNDSVTWNPELVPSLNSRMDVSTHARPLNDARSTESLKIISGQSGVFLQNPLDTSKSSVLVQAIENGIVQQSNVSHEPRSSCVFTSSCTFPFNSPNYVVVSNTGESENLNSHKPVPESIHATMNTVDFELARQEAERELFGRTLEDECIALDLLRANQSEESGSQESSLWSLSNNYPSQSSRILEGTITHPHLQQIFPMSASTISRNDDAASIFNPEMRPVNSVISSDNSQIELRSASIQLPRSSGILQTTKRVRFEAQVTDAETRGGFIYIRPAKTTSRGVSQAVVEQRKR